MTRAALYDRTGGPDVLYIGAVRDSEPGPGQVVVRVHAAGLNPFDGKQRTGFVPSQVPFPRRLGSDLAGTVIAVGDGASYGNGSPINVGDEVLGRGEGTIADRAVASAHELVRRPDAVPVEVAGGLWVAGLTAVSCLVTVPVDERDVVLIGGASGAVGLVAAQLAIAAGARVIGTAAERNHAFLRSIRVEPVAYGEGLAERVRDLASVTAVIDCHGREALDAGVESGVPVDRMVAIAAYAAVGELGVHTAERAARTAENLAHLVDRITTGALVLPVADAFALDDVAAAFTALESEHAPGKIIVTP